MDEKDLQESKLDAAASRVLEDLAQRISRRGILARLGKFTMGLVGLSLLPNLPVDRTFVGEAQGIGCTDWRLCGIYGNLCTNCCGGSGSLTNCPSCLTKGGFAWTKCCPFPDDECGAFRIAYWDCCGSDSTCKGTRCTNNTVQPAWCSGGAYQCTIAVLGASCSP